MLRQNESFISMNGSPLQLPSDWQPPANVQESTIKLDTTNKRNDLHSNGKTPCRRSVRLSLRPSIAPSARQSLAFNPVAPKLSAQTNSKIRNQHHDECMPMGPTSREEENEVIISLQDLKTIKAVDDIQNQTHEDRERFKNDILDIQKHLNSLLAQIDPDILKTMINDTS